MADSGSNTTTTLSEERIIAGQHEWDKYNRNEAVCQRVVSFVIIVGLGVLGGALGAGIVLLLTRAG